MKKQLGFLLLLSMALYLGGCADSSSSVDKLGAVSVRTEMTSSTVSSTFDTKSPSVAAGPTCDSVVIQRVRFLISELKMHRDDKDSASFRRKIKAGVFVLEFTPGDIRVLANNDILTGSYEKLKFEIHRLDSKADSLIINTPEFADFLKGGEHYTCIINGLVYNNGNGTLFEFLSNRNENITMHFSPPIEISQTVPTSLFFTFDPSACFIKAGGRTLDPRYSENQKEIEKLILEALKVLRK